MKENELQDNKSAVVGDQTTKRRKRKEVMREPPSPDFEETLGDVSAERERERKEMAKKKEETANARERKLRENRDG